MPRNRKNQRGYKRRRVNVREVKQRFLIICEGEQTEPNYFRAFHVPREVVVRVMGLGRDPLTLVREAERLRRKSDYDQVWVVFDRDDVPVERFNRALAEADRLQIDVAYSNQAFELWFVLHFEYVNTARTRTDYINRLNQLLDSPYSKRDETLYETLLARQPTALQNAARLLNSYAVAQPSKDDPSTTVHLLVAQLNRFL